MFAFISPVVAVGSTVIISSPVLTSTVVFAPLIASYTCLSVTNLGVASIGEDIFEFSLNFLIKLVSFIPSVYFCPPLLEVSFVTFNNLSASFSSVSISFTKEFSCLPVIASVEFSPIVPSAKPVNFILSPVLVKLKPAPS